MTSETFADPYEAAVRSLLAKKARLQTEIEAIEKSLSAIEEARGAATPIQGPNVPAVSASLAPTPPPFVSEKFKGLGLEGASTKVLSESDHLELTAKQIWTALSAAGYSLLSDRPEQSVSWALRKREKKVGDVILVGDGKWGLVEWYSPAQIKKFRDTRNNASGRNHIEHVARTKAGIANAKNTRLDHWGRKRSITAEQMTAAYDALRNGARSKLQAAKAGNMAWPTFNYYWCQYEMEKWKPGESWPPPRREIPKTGPEIRLEDMWPREKGSANGNGTAASSTVPH